MNTRAANSALLIVRIALGVIFIAHGGQKLFGWFGGVGLEQFAGFMGGLGLPAPKLMAILAGSAEFFGGLGVLVGLLTRIAACGPAAVMLVAIFKIHLAHGFFLENQGFEYCLALLGMSLALVIRGAGDWSLDAQRGKARPKL